MNPNDQRPQIVYGAKVDLNRQAGHPHSVYTEPNIQRPTYPQQNAYHNEQRYNPGYVGSNQPPPVVQGHTTHNMPFQNSNQYPPYYHSTHTAPNNNPNYYKPPTAQTYADDPNLLTDNLDITIRHGFIRKVYGILVVQLLVTFCLMFTFSEIDTLTKVLIQHKFIFYVAFIAQIAIMIAITCFTSVGRKFPLNYILLFIYSILQGIIFGYLALATDRLAIFTALGLTLAVVLSLTCFACQTRIDFTGFGAFGLVCGIILLGCVILSFIFRSKIFSIIVSGLACLVASFYIVYDTQQIVGGKRRQNQLSIDDYAYGALALYSDIVLLFISILNIVSSVSSND